MDSYQEARILLPKMPEEIFQLWFDGRIENNGWPPNTPTWAGALLKKPFDYWQKLTWEKRVILLALDNFTISTRNIISGLIDANFNGIINLYTTGICDSRERLADILDYMGRYKQIPSILIFMQDSPQYEIVDGCHRLAAFFF